MQDGPLPVVNGPTTPIRGVRTPVIYPGNRPFIAVRTPRVTGRGPILHGGRGPPKVEKFDACQKRSAWHSPGR